MYYDEDENSLRVYRVIEHKLGEAFLVGLYLRKKDADACCRNYQEEYKLSYFVVEDYYLEFDYKGKGE